MRAERSAKPSRPLETRDGAAILGLILFSAALGAARLVRRPDLVRGASDYLFGDLGFNLLVAEQLLSGHQLYGAIAFQYGPVPPLLHAGVAAIFGNTLSTYYLLLLLVSLANIGLAYLVIRSCASRLSAIVVVGLGLTASLLIPGSTLGAISGASYIPFERTVLLLAALLWTPPVGRSRRRAILLGCAIGAWQGVRFGGAGFLLMAIVAADLLALHFGRDLHRDVLRRWAQSMLWTLVAVIGLQLVWAAIVVATLPAAIAADVLWPMHMLKSYRGWVATDLRWPQWSGWRMLFGQFLSPLAGATAGVAAVVFYLRSNPRTGPQAPDNRPASLDQIRLLIPFFFYAVASVAFFRMVFHFFQFAWALVIPAAWALERRSRLVRLMTTALLVPCFALNVRINVVTLPTGEGRLFNAPNGEGLWASPASIEELNGLTAALHPAADFRADGALSVLVLPLGAGFAHAYGVGNSLRQAWLYEGMFRPYDEAQLLNSLDTLDAVILVDPEPSTGGFCANERTRPLSPETCSRLAERLESPSAFGRFLLYRLRK